MALEKQNLYGEEPPASRPRHVAIIMDGNGRWAQRRGLPRQMGHAAGSETFRTIATHCKDIGLEYLTVYAFSTENWKRSKSEVEGIIGLLRKYLFEAIEKMERDGIRLNFMGDLSALSSEILTLIAKTQEINKRVEGFQVNVCFNYGGRDEIVRAAREAARLCAEGRMRWESVDEGVLSRLLYSSGLPDPDLIIRPSGEMRVSNFLLWQSAYAEFYFTDTLWPDFTPDELDRAIAAYAGRSRRFGGV